jgi:tRNA 2-selenouridine synthase
MEAVKKNVEDFLQLAKSHLVLDVRSPGEYKHAHLPGAYSLPLFTDEERKVVGTAYKQQSRELAIKIGLDYFGLRMRSMVEEVEALLHSRKPEAGKPNDALTANSRTVLVHCWRGGMRSAAIAWLLDLYGFKVVTLNGGYKKFRNYVLNTWQLPFEFKIIGGYTGSGKTEVLHALKCSGQTAVDLEELASHKGSAFGNLGMPPQPSQEMFENKLALNLRESYTNPATTIWLEDESQRIGNVNIPHLLWNNMRKAPLFFLDIPFEERLRNIINWYGEQDVQRMINAIERIQKRLGPLESKTAIGYLQQNNIADAFRILLLYYDKFYNKSMQRRPLLEEQLIPIQSTNTHATENAALLLETKHKQYT